MNTRETLHIEAGDSLSSYFFGIIAAVSGLGCLLFAYLQHRRSRRVQVYEML